MAQNIFNTPINPSTTSGIQLAGYLSDFRDALVSGLSGTSRPASLTQGGTWVDTTDAGTGYLYLTMFDGTSDVVILTINTNTGTASVGNSDSLFEVQKVSNDDVPAIISLFKRRLAGAGQTEDGDSVGKVTFQGYNDSSIKTEVSYFEVVMTDNLTNSTKGSFLRYMAAVDGSGAVVEVYRVVDGNFALGTLSPEAKLHIVGADAELLEQRGVDADPVKLKLRKSRNGGQVLSLDDISQININAVDDAANDTTVASISTQATQNHTATAKGTKLTISNTVTGAAGQSEAIVLSDFIDLKRKTLASEIQFGSNIDQDGNFKFATDTGKFVLQKRTSGTWNTVQEWE